VGESEKVGCLNGRVRLHVRSVACVIFINIPFFPFTPFHFFYQNYFGRALKFISMLYLNIEIIFFALVLQSGPELHHNYFLFFLLIFLPTFVLLPSISFFSVFFFFLPSTSFLYLLPSFCSVFFFSPPRALYGALPPGHRRIPPPLPPHHGTPSPFPPPPLPPPPSPSPHPLHFL